MGTRSRTDKLNERVSREGNALIDLGGLPSPGSVEERAAIAGRLREMRYEVSGVTYEAYIKKFAGRGGLVVKRVGVGTAQVLIPSVQLRVTLIKARGLM